MGQFTRGGGQWRSDKREGANGGMAGSGDMEYGRSKHDREGGGNHLEFMVYENDPPTKSK